MAPRNRSNQQQQQQQQQDEATGIETRPTTSVTSNATRKIIDARNEQEFPSLGGNGPINIRPSVALNMRPSTSGLARTKENFPALGGGGTQIREPFRPPNTAISTTALFRMPAKAATGNGASSKSNSSNKTKPVLIKSAADDFPALPGGLSSSKQQHRANMERDMIETPLSFNPSLVSAKHRVLVQSYEQVSSTANMLANQKIKTIQRAETKSPSATNESVPSIKSKENFPSLGGTNSTTGTAPQWLNGTSGNSKKEKQISKKLKVAPAPILPTSKSNENIKKDDDKKGKSKTNQNEKKKEATKPESTNEKNSNGKKTEKDKAKKSEDSGKKTKENNEKNTNGNKNEKKPATPKPEQNGIATSANEIINSYSSVAHFTMPPPGFPVKKNDSNTKIPPGFESLSKESKNSTYSYMSPSNALQRNQVSISFGWSECCLWFIKIVSVSLL